MTYGKGNTNYAVTVIKNNYSNVEADLIIAACPANSASISITLESNNEKLTQNFLDSDVKNMIFSYITIGVKS